MLSKIINHFDISTHGWFDCRTNLESTDQSVHFAQEEIIHHATDIWSLWVKRPTAIKFDSNNSPTQQPLHQVVKDYLQMREQIIDHFRCDNGANESVINAHLKLYDTQFPEIYGDNIQFDITQFLSVDLFGSLDNPTIHIPSEYLSPTIIKKTDEFLLADALTGYGLEMLERNKFALRDLNHLGMVTLHGLYEEASYRPPPNSIAPVPVQSVVAACTLDIWHALLRKNIRNHILNTWPGWSDYFTARDQIMAHPPEEVKRAVVTKSKHRSPLRRMCMALAFNLNAVDPNRIAYPRLFQGAVTIARNAWNDVITTPHTNGDRLMAIRSLVLSLLPHLSAEEYPPNSKSRSPNSGSSNNLSSRDENEFLPNALRSRGYQRGLLSHTIDVTPRSNATESPDPEPQDPGTTTPPPAVFTTSLPTPNDHVPYNKEAIKQLRKPISDRVSGASWFVQGPPPSDHGQLQGMLDEGNLLRYAAFSDPAIFLTPPERGLGHIALCVLVDSSGSMNSPVIVAPASEDTTPHRRNRLSEAIAFIAGLRDGLAKSPHVSLHSFAYDSLLLNKYKDPTYPLPPEALTHHKNSYLNFCRLRPLATDEDLLCTDPSGGTPTGTAILAAHNYLSVLHPDSTRVILVLTDGEPCGQTNNPFDSTSTIEYRESEEGVKRLISLIDTPVFAVGFGSIRANSLRSQYNPGHYFVVENPSHAVNVACDLIAGIGQSLAQ